MVPYHRKVSIFHKATWYVGSDLLAKSRRSKANKRQEELEQRKEAARAMIKSVLLDAELDLGSLEVLEKAAQALKEQKECEEEQSSILAERTAAYEILAENSRAYFADAELNNTYHLVYDALHRLGPGLNEERRQQCRLWIAERLYFASGDVMRAIEEEAKDFTDSLEALANLACDLEGIPYLKDLAQTVYSRFDEVGIRYQEHEPSGREYFGPIRQLLKNERLLRHWLGGDWKDFQGNVESICKYIDTDMW